MFLVKNRPTAVRRKLLSEMRLLSKGKYQGRGDSFTSFARSFSHMTFGHKNEETNIIKTKIHSDVIRFQKERKTSHLTSKPACFKASRHFTVNLMSGRPSPISISACVNRIVFICVYSQSKIHSEVI